MDKWVEIDADKVVQNLAAVQEKLKSETLLLAVLKNNAYGQGDVSVGQLLARKGVTYFGVTYLEEAMKLRQAGIETDILIFAPLETAEDLKLAFRNNLTVTVASQHDAQLVNLVGDSLNFRLRVHIKMDTGLSRFGLSAGELVAVCQSLKENEQINLEGIYTHMADPGNRTYTKIQFDRFQAGLESLEAVRIRFRLRHCAGSAVFLNYPHMHLDMVRIGTLLTGQFPAGMTDPEMNLADPFQFKTKIVAVNARVKGAFVGYKRTHRLSRRMNIAVIPVGYADGLAVEVNNPPEGFVDLLKRMAKQFLAFFKVGRFRLKVQINDHSYPVVGKVFMQMALVEIPITIHIEPGDEVIVPVRKTLIGKEVARVFAQSGEVGMVDNRYVTKEEEEASAAQS